MKEINIGEINLDIQEMGLITKVRPCKAIMPRTPGALGGYYGLLPRIVKSKFKVPPNWEVVEEVKPGQVLADEGWRGSLVHTCESHGWDECVRGFWATRKD